MKPDMYSKVRSSDYDQISAGDEPSELDLAEGEKLFAATTRTYSKQPWSRWPRLAGLICAGVVSVLLIFALGFMSGYDQGSQLSSTSSTSESLTSSTKIGAANCTEPYFRREWRSLAVKEKKDYLDAVQCFIDSPSMLNMNGSLYDDFSWVHNLVAHSSKPFPPSPSRLWR